MELRLNAYEQTSKETDIHTGNQHLRGERKKEEIYSMNVFAVPEVDDP